MWPPDQDTERMAFVKTVGLVRQDIGRKGHPGNFTGNKEKMIKEAVKARIRLRNSGFIINDGVWKFHEITLKRNKCAIDASCQLR